MRGARTQRLDLTPQSAGLLAISLGLRSSFEDDLEVLRHGFVLYALPLVPGAQQRGAQLATQDDHVRRW